ncbi:MAG: hypothetical protein DRN96_07455 [Thermoproteota archaeon]|nr:MAG: hypothetical protein DRN96_07455 [Candidatus Korarchaeota archaeon]RLG53363.1 MAG: hypothetical protein DRN99_06860 [Candidatus Korarchaeota archaeon]
MSCDVSLEVREAIHSLLKMMYSLSSRLIWKAQEALNSPSQPTPPAFDLIDCLPFDEALLVCAHLLKEGFKHGRDFKVYRCGPSYGITLGEKASKATSQLIQDLQAARVIQKLATEVLREWRSSAGRRCGDVYEAIELASMAAAERSKLSSRRCPQCGRNTGVEVKEALHGRTYVISARWICCNHREKATISLTY